MINVEDYMPMVSKLTYEKWNKFKHKYEYEDLFQAGCVGLVSAAKSFDESKGVKFSTYAYTRIFGSISNYIRNDKWYMGKNKKDRVTANAPYSLDSFTNENKKTSYLDELVYGNNEDFESIELKMLLDKLPYKLKKIIKLKYFEDLTQKQISKILDTSQVNASRYEKEALEILRKEMLAL